MAEFLITSAILTIVLNLVIRLPVVRGGIGRWLASLSAGARRGPDPRPDPLHADPDRGPQPGRPGAGRPRVQVHVPWKAMLAASLALTVLVNLANLLF